MRHTKQLHTVALRVLIAAGCLAAQSTSTAQFFTVVYEGTGEVAGAATGHQLLPFAVNAGDSIRFRATVSRVVPPLEPPTPGMAEYVGAVQSLEFWINQAPIDLRPRSGDSPFNSVIVRNDLALPGFSRDGIELVWRYPSAPGVELKFTAGAHSDLAFGRNDWLTSDGIPLRFDFATANGGSFGIQARRIELIDGVETVTDIDDVVIRPTRFYAVGGPGTPGTTAPSGFGPLPLLSTQVNWHAAATTAQVPGSPSGDGRRVRAAVWFNTAVDEALFQLTNRSLEGVTRLSIRCGLAGLEGPVVWTSAEIERFADATIALHSRDLTPTAPSAACPAAIGNVAALKAAAEDRLLYLEVEGSHPTLRGQFWPDLHRVHLVARADASDQQAVGAETRAPLWQRASVLLSFSDLETADAPGGFGAVHYEVPRRHRFGSVTLHCAPAGVDGPAVAALPVERGVLSNADLIALPAGTACGMPIATTAALREALLRGHLYAVLEPSVPAGLVIRGQFRAP